MSGSIFKEGSGYRVVVQVNGKPVKRRAKTMAQARRIRSELLQLTEAPVSGVKLSDAIRSHLEAREGLERSRSTNVRDEHMARTCLDFFGDVKVTSLKVPRVDDFLRALADGSGSLSGKPLGRASIVRHRNLLIAMLDNEIRLGRLSVNVARSSVVPQASTEKTEKTALTKEQLQAVSEAGSDRVKALVSLCGRHGLRPSEARALRWADIEGDILTVSHQMDRKGNLVSPKTKGARRQVKLVDELPQSESEFVLGRVDAANLRRELRQACEAAEVLVVTPYELRHSALSHMVDQGHSLTAVADWAGTSERMIADTYRHRMDLLSPLVPE